MTSEVAVLNSIGVALAADSAVTVGGNAEKIYTSAEKLFRLADTVGVMVYGSAVFEDIPWETIIKFYRKYLGSQRFDSVKEYGENLISWLAGNYEMFTKENRQQQVIRLIQAYYLYLRENIRTDIDEIAIAREGIAEEDLPDIFHKIIRTRLQHIRESPQLDGFSKEEKEHFQKEISPTLKNIKNDIFGELPFKPSTKRLLTTMAYELLVRHYFGPLVSGIVVAGFGNNEFMPAVIAYEVEEIFGSKIRLVKTHEDKITNTGNAFVIPFAQQDMVYVFMEGIDSQLNEFMMDTTAELLIQFFQTLVNYVKETDVKLAEKLERVVTLDDLIFGLFDGWNRRRQGHWFPVLQVVATLPKNELAEMAESLVNLTKLRRKVTTVPETVGGPVDVAIITKGDGFVWIKRKHYFDSSINPGYFSRYREEAVQ